MVQKHTKPNQQTKTNPSEIKVIFSFNFGNSVGERIMFLINGAGKIAKSYLNKMSLQFILQIKKQAGKIAQKLSAWTISSRPQPDP